MVSCKIFKRCTLFFHFLLLTTFVIAQSENDKNLIAESTAFNEDFSAAIPMYKKWVTIDPENPILFYKLGYCYLNTFGSEDSSIRWINKAIQVYNKNKTENVNIQEYYFTLARAYRAINEFDSAIIILENLRRNNKDTYFAKTLKQELQLAVAGQKSFRDGLRVEIKNLGGEINSPYTEHSPLFIVNGSTLVYTSFKANSDDSFTTEEDSLVEDIFVTHKTDSGWSQSQKISSKTEELNQSAVSLTPDGNSIFIYSDAENGSIFTASFDGTKWTSPQKLPYPINTRHRETHASYAPDGKTLYFCSNRPGGYGGLDIYFTKLKKNGKWSRPKNLGKGINSKYNEEGVYITQDGKTLYFSSNDVKGFGGYDVYKCTKNEFDTWSYPENLGYPINSISDDIYYFPIDSSLAYFASRRDGGKGETDLYELFISYKDADSLSIMTAQIETCEIVLKSTVVNILDVTTGKESVATPNQNGKFVFITYKGNNYEISVKVQDKEVYKDTIKIPPTAKFYENYKQINLYDLRLCDD